MSPLDGIRIIDLSRYAPGPFCTLLCAALGAEIVKVEPLEGDPLRQIDSEAFARLNRGKKSVALDLKDRVGRARFLKLVRTADVLVEGFRPGTMTRLGFDYASLERIAPGLIYIAISGYGQSGGYRERAGHDINYMAAAGALHGARAPLPIQVADFAAGGLFAALGVLSSLMERQRTGTGRYLDVSMYHGLRSLMMLAEGSIGEKLSGRNPNYALYSTRDGETLSVGALEPKFWERFCEGIDRRDLIDRHDDETARVEVAREVRMRDARDWREIFNGLDACVEMVRSPKDASATTTSQQDESSSFPERADLEALAPAPELGQHSREFFE
ncbi:MAG TPA: CaiB/BaiF CoA-transferase family protein [Vicinamibacteria bacterium]|nr:CaiB/BaiF CoA-transferase family protein [Vicinamibacteria bacterium]